MAIHIKAKIKPPKIKGKLELRSVERKRRPKREDEYDRNRRLEREARTRMFAEMNADPRYNRLWDMKDAALAAWTRADHYALSKRPADIERALRAAARAKRVLRAFNAFIDRYERLWKAGRVPRARR